MARLHDLKWETFRNTQLGCLKGCADYLGIGMSDAWLFGGTGAAFMFYTDERGYGAGGSWYQGPMLHLCNNLGFTVNGVYGFKSDDDFALKQQMAWESTQNAIDRGFPCYGYNLGIPEYYIVYGYEREGYLFTGLGVESTASREESRIFAMTPELEQELAVYGDDPYVSLDDAGLVDTLKNMAKTKGYHLKGNIRMVNHGGVREIISDSGDQIILRGEGYTPWRKLGTVHIGLLEMYWVEPGQESNPRDTTKEALAFALEFAQGPGKWVRPPYRSGLNGYDLWIRAVQSANPDLFALSYNSQCWAECRHYAAAFLREAATKIGGEPANRLLAAAKIYDEIYDHWQTFADLLPFDGKQWEINRQQLAQMAVGLQQARQQEEAALSQLEEVVRVL